MIPSNFCIEYLWFEMNNAISFSNLIDWFRFPFKQTAGALPFIRGTKLYTKFGPLASRLTQYESTPHQIQDTKDYTVQVKNPRQPKLTEGSVKVLFYLGQPWFRNYGFLRILACQSYYLSTHQ
jgi:hypothetical protein